MVSNDVREIHKRIVNIKNIILNCKYEDINTKLGEKTIQWLLRQGIYVFSQEPMLVQTHGPIHVCGDIHGQYIDLLNVFENLGLPGRDNRYLLLGDYVDRGLKSIEVFCLLLCYKLLYPNDVFMLRGNHETSAISRMYGFYDECKRKFGVKMWKLFVDVFNYMPVAATIGKNNHTPLVLCMHGGISPHLTNLDDIKRLRKPTDIPDEGLLCDLLWADPDSEFNKNGWNDNDRGVSYVFGRNVLNSFLTKNCLDLIVRGHQVVEDGYEFFGGRQLITIFTAPRYCGEFDNKGGVLSLSKELVCKVHIFD